MASPNGAPPVGLPAPGAGVPFDVLAQADKSAAPYDAVARDPGFQQPIDATKGLDRARASLIYRDIPLVTIQNTWSVEQARGALYAHMIGVFDASAQLCDSILGDDRVTACLNSKATALFGRETRFRAADDSDAAKECLRAWEAWWPRMTGDSAMREMQDYSTLMGFAHAQVMWDTTQRNLSFAPCLRPWHARFEYYDWYLRRYMALSQDGTFPIVPGNGKWIEHAPYGSYRGWIRGAIRPVTEPWMLRHFGFRDMARFGEVHGNPTRKGYVPVVSDPVERSAFEDALSRLGADTALIVPRGVDGANGDGYDYELVEAQSAAWEVHPTQIDRCDMAIVLALLMVNLTTEVGNKGSYAATDAHMDKERGGTEFDNQAWKNTIYTQLARPFAYLNFGDADLAPWTWRDVTGRATYAENAKQLQAFGTGIEVLRRGGIEFDDVEALRQWASEQFGLPGMPSFKIKEPVAGGLGGGASKSKLPFKDVDPAAVVKVNEARELNGLGPMDGGDVTIQEFHEDKAADREKDVDASAAESESDAKPEPEEKPSAPARPSIGGKP